MTCTRMALAAAGLMTAVTACVPDHVAATPLAVAIPSPTLAVTTEQPTTLVPTATGRGAPVVETTDVQARVVTRCPPDATVDLIALGMPGNWALLQSPDREEDLRKWQLLLQTKEQVPVGGVLDIPGTWLEFRGISPSHRQVASYAYRDLSDTIDIWVLSPEAGTTTRVVEGLDRPRVVEWLGDGTLAILDNSGGQWPSTWMLVDVTTAGQRRLPEVQLELAHAFSPDGTRLIYLAPVKGGWQVRLRDFDADTDDRVLPWLEPEVIQSPSSIRIQWTDAGVTLSVIDSLRLTVTVALSPDSLLSKAAPTGIIEFPRGAMRSISSWFSPDGRWIAIWRGYGEYLGSPDTTWEFLILDTHGWSLYDYCLPSEWLAPGAIAGSPDGQFLTLAREGIGSVVLDLATGKRAYLEGQFVSGWLVTSP